MTRRCYIAVMSGNHDTAKPARARPHAVQVRFDAAEHAAFHRLVSARQRDLCAEGITVNASDVLRWLVAREVEARGLTGLSAKKERRR